MAERWTPDGWRGKPVLQMPNYPDAGALADVEAQLATFPPLLERFVRWRVLPPVGSVIAIALIATPPAVGAPLTPRTALKAFEPTGKALAAGKGPASYVS